MRKIAFLVLVILALAAFAAPALACSATGGPDQCMTYGVKG